MNSFKTMLMTAALVAPGALLAGVSHAQVGGVAVVDPDGAVGNSNAWKTAASQLQTTYKATLDQAEARRQAIANEIQPLVAKAQADQKANVPQAQLQTQLQAIQAKEQAGNAELQRMTLPYARARGYAIEQIQAQLKAAIDAAAARKKASIVIGPNDVVHLDPAGDLTADVTTELNRLVPSVSIAPPANWQPGQQGGAAAPAPANTKQPQGR
ncbi:MULTISPECIES: OmpH family outer membrane protein [Sphingomonas]|uniref:OmpH family outer membrane protein n=1 Tax=Sphingomonas lycopersici TaxID=2951807 RepID=A0AA41ZD64_9SPHN|nr:MULTISPECIES: OmpH family outer membrane protein [Sphingomonas]MCW6529617.1 OmpH family outer membrane protein [Sphingomonas lycopersici]MCW6534461.1 OmpH family outer membrane protein [Sphingomonas lycopersici]OJU19981.1 MAG: outer membrane family protein [Sphingomonas sp. 66-10]